MVVITASAAFNAGQSRTVGKYPTCRRLTAMRMLAAALAIVPLFMRDTDAALPPVHYAFLRTNAYNA